MTDGGGRGLGGSELENATWLWEGEEDMGPPRGVDGDDIDWG